MTTELRARIALAVASCALAVQTGTDAQGAVGRAAASLSDTRPVGGSGGQPVVVRVSGGFHWGDAAIGAAGACGLMLLIGGVGLGAGRVDVSRRMSSSSRGSSRRSCEREKEV